MQNSTFSEYGHLLYQIKGNDACSNMVTNILPLNTHFLILGLEPKGQNSTFPEHGHVAYPIKGNDGCSNMQSHIMSFQHP